MKSLRRKQHFEEHEEQIIELFCKTCEKTICRDCALVKHREHDYTFVREIRTDIQVALEELVRVVKAKETEFMGYKKYTDNLRRLSKSALVACTKEVEDMYVRIVAQLEAHRSTLIGHPQS